MERENEIKEFMTEELKKGLELSDIQKLVNERFGLHMTYMEIRILASELESVDWRALDPRAQAEAAKKAKQAESETQEPAAPGEAAADAPAAGDGATVVELSKLARPGMMLSGTVKFASGSTAEWYVDQMGRLGLGGDLPEGYRPSPTDAALFQQQLMSLLQSKGLC